MKKYNDVLALVVLFFTYGLYASDKPDKSVFNKLAHNVFVQCAGVYAGSSLSFHAIGEMLRMCSGAPISTNKIVDFDILYNDTFPKNYQPQSVMQKMAANTSRACSITGSICSAPLRSIVSVLYNSIETLGEEISFKRHVDYLKREAYVSSEKLVDLENLPNISTTRIVQQTAKQMARGSLYGVLGFGMPYVYSKLF